MLAIDPAAWLRPSASWKVIAHEIIDDDSPTSSLEPSNGICWAKHHALRDRLFHAPSSQPITYRDIGYVPYSSKPSRFPDSPGLASGPSSRSVEGAGVVAVVGTDVVGGAGGGSDWALAAAGATTSTRPATATARPSRARRFTPLPVSAGSVAGPADPVVALRWSRR